MKVLRQGSEERRRWLSSGIAARVILFGCGGKSTPTGPSPGGGGGSSSPPLSRLELFPAQRVAVIVETLTPRVIARDPAGADVANVVPAYSTSNPGLVRIEPDGRLVANGAGTATVRVNAGGQTAETLIHVGPATYDLGQGPPQVLNASFIDLSKIERISRFRSTIGHSYDAFLRRRFFFWKTDLESARRAAAEFRAAIALEPASADAHAGLSLSRAALDAFGVAESSGESMQASRQSSAIPCREIWCRSPWCTSTLVTTTAGSRGSSARSRSVRTTYAS